MGLLTQNDTTVALLIVTASEGRFFTINARACSRSCVSMEFGKRFPGPTT